MSIQRKNDEVILWGTSELMRYLGFGRDKALALMKTPGFPSMKISKNYYVLRDDLKKWLSANVGHEVNI